MTRPVVLVVDGDTRERSALESIIVDFGADYRGAAGPDDAVAIAGGSDVQILVVDAGIRAEALVALLQHASRNNPSLVAIGLGTELGTVQARALMEAGLFDVAPRPLQPARVLQALNRALEQHRLQDRYLQLRDGVRGRSGYRRLVGRSAFMENLRGKLEALAAGESTVLFYGPAGSGRELAARYLHQASRRNGQPFRMLDCRSYPADVLEAELFGGPASPGLLEAGCEGAVLLEEVASLPAVVQERLEGLLAGGNAGCRLLASTSVDLAQAAAEGRFHPGLLKRLTAATVVLEPLSRRMEDLPLLASHFLETICRINNLPPIRLSPAVLDLLGRYHWPGNIRELRNAMEQAAILASGTIQPEDLPARIRKQASAAGAAGWEAGPVPFRAAKKQVVDAFEARYLDDLLRAKRGNVTAAAEQAGMLRSALQRLLRKHGIRSSDYRGRRGARAAATRAGVSPAD